VLILHQGDANSDLPQRVFPTKVENMQRSDFHNRFDSPGPVILPVIHVLDDASTAANIDRLVDAGIKGCFLINHDFGIEPFLPIIEAIRTRYPDFWIGLNFLAVTGLKAFPILAELGARGTPIDAYWADDARIDERRAVDDQPEADEIASVRASSGWSGLYIGGTAFKKQRDVDPAQYGKSARIATNYMDVVVTSGVATGHAADVSKINTFRENCGHTALGLASGITPENAEEYADAVDLFMVATGINHNGDFYNIDPERLKRLMDLTQT